MARQVAYAEATVATPPGRMVSRSTGTFLLHRTTPRRADRRPRRRSPGHPKLAIARPCGRRPRPTPADAGCAKPSATMVHPVLPPGAGPGSRARATTRQTTTRQTTTRQTATGRTAVLCLRRRHRWYPRSLLLLPPWSNSCRCHWRRWWPWPSTGRRPDAPVAAWLQGRSGGRGPRLVHRRASSPGWSEAGSTANGLRPRPPARQRSGTWSPRSRPRADRPVRRSTPSWPAVPALADRHRGRLVRGSRPVDHLVADRLGFVPAPGVEAAALRRPGGARGRRQRDHRRPGPERGGRPPDRRRPGGRDAGRRPGLSGAVGQGRETPADQGE